MEGNERKINGNEGNERKMKGNERKMNGNEENEWKCGDTQLPISVRQRVAETEERVKRSGDGVFSTMC